MNDDDETYPRGFQRVLNFGINIKRREREHPDPFCRRRVRYFHFKGTRAEVKAKVQETLRDQEGTGWTVFAVTDDETMYCAYN